MLNNDDVSLRIEKWFEGRDNEFLHDLNELVSVMSVAGAKEQNAPFGIGPRKVLDKASELIKGYGFEPTIYADKVVFFEMNDKTDKLGILAHLDTVGVTDGWDTYPFELTFRDGVCYGRGVSDDKGPALSALYAVRCVNDIFPELSFNCRTILGSDEETGSTDIADYMANHKMPENVFSPDADFPVINTEKGRMSHSFGSSWLEEDGATIVSIDGGNTVNIVPQTAEAIIKGVELKTVEKLCRKCSEETGAEFTFVKEGDTVKITCNGKASHAAEPELGNNAQTALCTLLEMLPLHGHGYESVKALNRMFPHGAVNGEGMGVTMEDEESGKLTMSFDVLHMNKTGFTAVYDSRVPVSADGTDIVERTGDRIKSAGFDIFETHFIPSHHTPADSPFVKTLLDVYECYTGEKGECLAIGGGTYVHEIEGGVAFGCVFPGKDTAMHGDNEHTELADLIKSAKIFARAIIEICK